MPVKTSGLGGYNDWKQRILEIMVGGMAWAFFALVIILSYVSVIAAAYVLIAYILLWLFKIFGYSSRLTRGYWRIRLSARIDWNSRLQDLHAPEVALEQVEADLSRNQDFMDKGALKLYRQRLQQAVDHADNLLNPDDIYNAVIVATYNEAPEILESTLQSIAASTYDKSRIMLIVAYEERGGPQVGEHARRLVAEYGGEYAVAEAIEHPADIPGELKAKAGNITYAARWLTDYINEHGFDPEQVIVSTLDADNRPSRQYLAEVAYTYAVTPARVRRSYQPIPMFFNNVWDAPALMRVIAASNSFWVLMECLRPHRLRNFSAHGQSLQTLIDTDYWNVASIVEDGHQYWRTYFTYQGDHRVLPIFSPIYQDAVLAGGYWRTFKAQFYQLRRWAWGVVDTPYLIRRSFHSPDIPWSSKLIHIFRQIEGYFSWAVAPVILAIGGWLPLLLYAEADRSMLAIQLPTIASYIQTGALIGLLAPIISTMLSLPPRPERYSRRRSVMMVFQWILVPIALIGFGSHAALNAQTRLLFGKYLGSFNVTEKKRVDAPESLS